MAEPDALRCFARTTTSAPRQHWFARWQSSYPGTLSLTSGQQEAFAHLVPLLLCGEQSAQQVFSHIAGRHGGILRRVLATIEQEEHVHERALQWVLSDIGNPGDLHRRKRRSQQFYASLGRARDAGSHFATVGQLDSGVCRIMDAIARSDLGRQHPLTRLFDAIKRDEANHVGVSRRCARELGASLSQERDIARRLVAFLTPDAHHFEAIGVCPDRLFRRIAGASS